MLIQLENTGKRFLRQWVIKNLSLTIPPASLTAITGSNGSGKSTLIQLLSGYMLPSKGSIGWFIHGEPILSADVYKYLSLASPHLDLIEEFTLPEILSFQAGCKAYAPGWDTHRLIEFSGLGNHGTKPIARFSSGMKQRVRLLLALASDTPMVLLDEPCSNLDQHSVAWYRELLQTFRQGRTIVVASNHRGEEYPDCDTVIEL